MSLLGRFSLKVTIFKKPYDRKKKKKKKKKRKKRKRPANFEPACLWVPACRACETSKCYGGTGLRESHNTAMGETGVRGNP